MLKIKNCMEVGGGTYTANETGDVEMRPEVHNNFVACADLTEYGISAVHESDELIAPLHQPSNAGGTSPTSYLSMSMNVAAKDSLQLKLDHTFPCPNNGLIRER